MRLKSLNWLVIVASLTASLLCATPAVAEENYGALNQSFASASNDAATSSMGSSATMQNDNSNNDANSHNDTNSQGSANGVDQATPDTATGDDDY